MIRLTGKLLAATALAGFAATPYAAAWEDTVVPIVIDQVQLGGTLANLDVYIPESAGSATALAVSVGNTGAGLVNQGNLDYSATQSNSGDATASTTVTGGMVYGTAQSSAMAYGNASTSTTSNGEAVSAVDQMMTGTTSATSSLRLSGSGTVYSSTTAAANVSNTSATYGASTSSETQLSGGDVHADSDAEVCCNGRSATYTTTAAGNTSTATGSTSTTIATVNQTTASGTTIAATGAVYMADGNDVVSEVTAAGNSQVIQNEWGYASLGREGGPSEQTNAADVSAHSELVLDHWSGTATGSAYSVGNSAVVSNVGSDTALYSAQDNQGDVSSAIVFAGQSWVGGAGFVDATAAGNVSSATLCNYCGNAAVYGSTQQVNSGNIVAQTFVNAPMSGGMTSSASAMGNVATYRSDGD